MRKRKSAHRDEPLGLNDPTITRRDFVGGTMLGAGAVLLDMAAPGVLRASQTADKPGRALLGPDWLDSQFLHLLVALNQFAYLGHTQRAPVATIEQVYSRRSDQVRRTDNISFQVRKFEGGHFASNTDSRVGIPAKA